MLKSTGLIKMSECSGVTDEEIQEYSQWIKKKDLKESFVALCGSYDYMSFNAVRCKYGLNQRIHHRTWTKIESVFYIQDFTVFCVDESITTILCQIPFRKIIKSHCSKGKIAFMTKSHYYKMYFDPANVINAWHIFQRNYFMMNSPPSSTNLLSLSPYRNINIQSPFVKYLKMPELLPLSVMCVRDGNLELMQKSIVYRLYKSDRNAPVDMLAKAQMNYDLVANGRPLDPIATNEEEQVFSVVSPLVVILSLIAELPDIDCVGLGTVLFALNHLHLSKYFKETIKSFLSGSFEEYIASKIESIHFRHEHVTRMASLYDNSIVQIGVIVARTYNLPVYHYLIPNPSIELTDLIVKTIESHYLQTLRHYELNWLVFYEISRAILNLYCGTEETWEIKTQFIEHPLEYEPNQDQIVLLIRLMYILSLREDDFLVIGALLFGLLLDSGIIKTSYLDLHCYSVLMVIQCADYLVNKESRLKIYDACIRYLTEIVSTNGCHHLFSFENPIHLAEIAYSLKKLRRAIHFPSDDHLSFQT